MNSLIQFNESALKYLLRILAQSFFIYIIILILGTNANSQSMGLASTLGLVLIALVLLSLLFQSIGLLVNKRRAVFSPHGIWIRRAYIIKSTPSVTKNFAVSMTAYFPIFTQHYGGNKSLFIPRECIDSVILKGYSSVNRPFDLYGVIIKFKRDAKSLEKLSSPKDVRFYGTKKSEQEKNLGGFEIRMSLNYTAGNRKAWEEKVRRINIMYASDSLK